MKKSPTFKFRDCKHCHFPIVPNYAAQKFCSLEHRDQYYKDTGFYTAKQIAYHNRKRVKPFAGATQCIICKLYFRAVCHHAWQVHELGEAEYKKMAGIDHGKGLIPEELKALKREHVFENGTVDNLKKGAKRRYVKGDTRAGAYERSPETKARLRLQGLKIARKK